MTRTDWRLNRPDDGMRLGWVFGAVWLVYLADPLNAALAHRVGPVRDLGVAAVVAFAAVYVFALTLGRRHRLADTLPRGWRPWGLVGGLVALTALMLPAAHQHALAALVFVGAATMFLLPSSAAWILVAALAVAAEVAVRLVPGWNENGSGLGVLLAAVAVYAIRVAFDRNRRLQQTQEEMAGLAVAAERSRFARDLHDILGHSLTVVTVKAELARRLVRQDPDRAEAEIADLERLSREALADVRRALAGYREVTLSGEIATARESLNAAGIHAELPTAVDDVPGRLRELFGWTIREGVTNVIRHSSARRCTIRADRNGVEIVDDGGGPDPGRPDATGHGLLGLRERASVVGAVVDAGPAGPDGGFRLRLSVPQAATGAPPESSGGVAAPAAPMQAGPG